MTKKRKRYPDLHQKLERPWCYYCERDFDDLKILISHQKAKHFKCDRCGRRLNTAGGLSVHMNQVHKENLTHVENANPGRQGLDIEIFGMEGVPAEIIDQHNQQVTQAHFAEEQERARITGNPIRGLYPNGQAPPVKRERVDEKIEEIENRADQFRTDVQNGVLPQSKTEAVTNLVCVVLAMEMDTASRPITLRSTTICLPTRRPSPGYPSPFPPSANGAAMPPRPGSIPGQPIGGALPPRPGFGAPPPLAAGYAHAQNGADPNAISDSIDHLIGEVTKEAAAAPPAAEKKEEKKSKKDKNMKLIFFDDTASPEEKMTSLPRFAEFVRS
ncbi:hypothetical protein N0V83_009362 [Neocucurbitaria cava]|uniref:Uncharacterized protein n=1 Tax=Neocucurbitaria cava TaxID=798079 RepID=A0A9W8Y0F9_9PLEO|nr:hypothetical protein N0V83_009362 [Neocucurbitaria cava]